LEAIARFLDQNLFETLKISITGGEPFYDLETTRGIVAVATNLRRAVTIVTSGFWAKTEKTAVDTLSQIPRFDTLIISCDPYHARFVPIAFIENGYRAAKSSNLDVRIRLVQSNPPTAEEVVLESAVREYAGETEIERQLLLKYGRAADLDLPTAGYASPEREYCPSSGPYIDADGSVLPCCNSIISIRDENPLRIGNITNESAKEIHSLFLRNSLLASLKIEGAPKLRQILRPTLGNEVDAMSVCDLCYAVCSSPQTYDQASSQINDQKSKFELYAFGALKLGMDELVPLLEEAAKGLA
jgi:MoaA/NifB/PqqE/SkfB family radical SAM enzyme